MATKILSFEVLTTTTPSVRRWINTFTNQEDDDLETHLNEGWILRTTGGTSFHGRERILFTLIRPETEEEEGIFLIDVEGDFIVDVEGDFIVDVAGDRILIEEIFLIDVEGDFIVDVAGDRILSNTNIRN